MTPRDYLGNIPKVGHNYKQYCHAYGSLADESRERTDEELVFIQSIGKDLADVLFKIVEWLLTNKFI